jgi:glycosyltransferase involved in cell wall biosynthesis
MGSVSLKQKISNRLKALLRIAFRALGKDERKVAAVFGFSPAACHGATLHLYHGAPDIPLWLFCTSPPLPETAALCERVAVRSNSLALFFHAQRELWRHSVAICAGAWTGGHGNGVLKLAPLLVPPFRAVFANDNGDFVPGTPANILSHGWRRLRDAALSGWRRALDLVRAYWLLVTYHIWRSGPCTRVKDITLAYWRLLTYHIWRSGPCTRTKDLARAYWRLFTYHIWRSGPCTRTKDLARAYWRLLTYHIWRSGPCTRVKDITVAYWRLLTYHIWRSGPCTRVKDLSCAYWGLLYRTLSDHPARAFLRAALKLIGKGDRQVAVVFGFSPETCRAGALYLQWGAPGTPIWLFSTSSPLDETAAICERVVVRRNAVALLFQAERELWPRQVAIAAGAWTGKRGNWVLKLAPLLVPPFRAVFANGNGDYLSSTPDNILRHCQRRLRDSVCSAAHLLRCHLLRSRGAVASFGRRVRDVAAASSLRLASHLLGCCGYPDRRLFHRLHGAERLRVLHVSAGGSGVAWFVRRPGPNWDGPAIERFALASRARWIAWSRTGGVPVAAMLPLFADQSTFAVSRQERHRQWRLPLFATAAFRALQPGEASQVLAPLSSTIVVDRAKLLALGIPKCKLAWTAWLLLFWKAAAAGWRSYSMGGSEPVRQEPDYPMEERAFLFHVLADPALRRLGPADPHLSRGNVAFEPAALFGERGDSGRLKVLIVSPFLPYPLSHGGAVRMFNLCRALAHRVNFALVAIHESRETVHYDKLREVFQTIRVVDMDEPVSQDQRLPSQVRQHQSRSLRETIARLAADWRPDLLQVEFTHMADFRDGAPDTPAILVEHDLTFSLYGQLADSERTEKARREYVRWLEFERRQLQDYDAVWTVSEQDRVAAIREGSRPGLTFSIPNGVDIFRFLPSDSPTPNPEILFVGSFRHLPNVLSFEKLRSEVMPRVWSVFPNAVARVVAGPDHEWFWRKLAPQGLPLDRNPRIEVHGFVEDLRPLYAAASVVVAPLEVSAGTNIKVLEAMACGKAIVTTPAGCGGLGLRDGREALIRADWPGFAAALCDVLNDADLRARLGRQARLAAERKFSWTAIQEEAYQSYLQVHERHTARVPHVAVGD